MRFRGMTRIVALSCSLVVTGALACHDQGPRLEFTWVELGRSGVASLESDSVTVNSLDSVLVLDGVMYAVSSWSCKPFTSGGERSGATLTLRVAAGADSQCIRVKTRLLYRATIRALQPGVYQLQVHHQEPDTPERDDRTVFRGPVVFP